MIAAITPRAAARATLLLRGALTDSHAGSRAMFSTRISATANQVGRASSSRSVVAPNRQGAVFCNSLPQAARCFSSSPTIQASSSGRTTVKDPEPQTGLYYHPTEISVARGPGEPAETVEGWAVSFLSQPSANDDAAIAFILPTTSSSSQDSEPADFVRANPDRIRINPAGWKIMHDVLKNEVVPHDDLLKFEASTRESGWAHLTDLRHPLMPGRIATPENIIASVAFTDGTLKVDSYEINNSYRLVTGYEGPIQMADSWIAKLRSRFEKL
ncbi:uncharacterized protein PAN0_003d1774 [Moesziomyces antarcticus]|uniref:Uncharacterized protein n=1 Tax=Pseudozyma antarctica TaxID=84753 RepID=A0A5C3FIZ8_PSEA2|nr:uncharacterized protein PAN0_003d1774 [Moesziomyces antarcticus]GAK63569.1 conserved hypothetical protein [Moesziomyces antarcticus]SPO44160.1 uncharacterized protein PSANT_01845 [Moesziomyces antarcticus]